MKKLICAILVLCLMMTVLISCSDKSKDEEIQPEAEPETPPVVELTEEEKRELRAEEILSQMTVEEMAAQMFLVRCDKNTALEYAKTYSPGGYILFGQDFKEETPESLREDLSLWQDAAKYGLIFAVDEEGGTVVRASRYEAFRSERFKSPQAIHNAGGMDAIKLDAKEKSEFLLDLGLNMNLAPVCDISQNPDDFIYDRAFGKGAAETAEYVSAVVSEMNTSNIGSALKHFPGYGGNVDTHTGIAVDDRPYEQFAAEDFIPFKAGIEAGADAVMVSHNTVLCMDSEYPASLSKNVHDILRNELSFDGVIMTDDLVMDAIGTITTPAQAAVIAVNAGNDMLISSDFVTQYEAVISACESGEISDARIYEAAKRVITMKLKLGIIE